VKEGRASVMDLVPTSHWQWHSRWSHMKQPAH